MDIFTTPYGYQNLISTALVQLYAFVLILKATVKVKLEKSDVESGPIHFLVIVYFKKLEMI